MVQYCSVGNASFDVIDDTMMCESGQYDQLGISQYTGVVPISSYQL